MGAFLDDTAPRRGPDHADGQFVGDLGDDWTIVFTFGGASLAAALRAMDAAVDRDDLLLVAAHAHFVSPVQSGPFTVDTEILRMGRTVAQVAGDLRSQDAPEAAIRVAGTWAQPRSDDTVRGSSLEPPAVDPPGDSRLVKIEHDPPWDQFLIHDKFEEWRSPNHFHPGALFIDGVPPEAAVWTRLTDSCRHRDGRFEPTSLALVADRVPGPHLGPCLASTADPDPRPLVSLEMTLRIYAEPATDWLLLHSRVDHAGDGHVTTHVNIWDEDHRLVATSEQLARFANAALPK